MADKIKYELEYLLKTSPSILYQSISTPSGLSEWFCDDVNIQNKNLFIFKWDGSEEEARLLGIKNREYIKFQWIDDEEEGLSTFFEMRLRIDAITKEVALIVTDFADEDELEESQLLWDSQVAGLKQHIGA